MSDRVLVLGASGGVGAELLRLLATCDVSVIAWSRRETGVRVPFPRATGKGHSDPCFFFSCHVGELFTDSLPDVDTILSAGPLDGLVAALSRSAVCRPRVIVALSSSSAHFKRESIDPGERALAARLAASEAALDALCRERDARCVILRPTLIYGGDDAAHFGAVVTQAQRFGFLALPGSARGLRMPIRVDDLAATMLRALDAPNASGVFDVGGGETLPYDQMIRRVLAARGLKPRVPRIPDVAFRALLRFAHYAGTLRSITDAMVMRMREDLVVDDAEARRVLGHAPGPFLPAALVEPSLPG